MREGLQGSTSTHCRHSGKSLEPQTSGATGEAVRELLPYQPRGKLMLGTANYNHPKPSQGKRMLEDLLHSLPYDASRVAPVCGHSPLYIIQFVEEQPLLCGLCFFRDGMQGEVPGRIHQFKTLAENGNPETSPKMLAHLQVVMGLLPPKEGESLQAYRKRRSALAREQFTVRSPLDHHLVVLTRNIRFSSPSRLFPVTSALWKLMGYQPPLGRVLVEGVNGRSEDEIADAFSTSVLDIYNRMTKAIRVGMRFIDDGCEGSGSSARKRGSGRSEETGIDESGPDDSES